MKYELFANEDNAIHTVVTETEISADGKTQQTNGASYSVDGETFDRFVEFSLNYEGNFRGDFQNHAGILNAKYKF